MKSKVLLLISTIALLVSLSFLAYAHFVETNEIDDLIYESANFKVSLSGNLSNDYLFPGNNIIETPLRLTNESNITIDLRVQISYQLNGLEFNDFKVAPSKVNDPSDVANDFNLDNSFELVDNYYVLTAGLPAGDNINILSSLILDGQVVQSDNSNQVFKIILRVDAKQQGSANWTNLGSNFITQ